MSLKAFLLSSLQQKEDSLSKWISPSKLEHVHRICTFANATATPQPQGHPHGQQQQQEQEQQQQQQQQRTTGDNGGVGEGDGDGGGDGDGDGDGYRGHQVSAAGFATAANDDTYLEDAAAAGHQYSRISSSSSPSSLGHRSDLLPGQDIGGYNGRATGATGAAGAGGGVSQISCGTPTTFAFGHTLPTFAAVKTPN